MGYTLDWREVFATFTYLHIYKYIYIYIYFLKYIVKRALPGEGEWSPPAPSSLEKLKKSVSQPRPKSYCLIKKSTRRVPPLSISANSKIGKL